MIYEGNYTELLLKKDDVMSGFHPGDCADDICAIAKESYISDQLNALDNEAVRKELTDYGSWSDSDLADHEENKRRLLWVACGDIFDNLED